MIRQNRMHLHGRIFGLKKSAYSSVFFYALFVHIVPTEMLPPVFFVSALDERLTPSTIANRSDNMPLKIKGSNLHAQ